MRNLAKIQPSVTDLVCRLELAWANMVPAYQAVRKCGNQADQTDVKSSIVGIVEYVDGQAILFIRKTDHWEAHLAEPPAQSKGYEPNPWFQKTMVRMRPGHPREFTPRMHELRTQNEMHEFMRQLAAHGPRKDEGDRRGTDDIGTAATKLLEDCGFHPEHILRVPWPALESGGARLQILTLLSYGAECLSHFENAECQAEALHLAENTYGRQDQRTQKMAADLSKFIKHHAELDSRLLSTLKSADPGRRELLKRLIFWTENRQKPLRILGYNEARTVADKNAAYRLELVADLMRERGVLLDRLNDLIATREQGKYVCPGLLAQAKTEYEAVCAELLKEIRWLSNVDGAARILCRLPLGLEDVGTP